MKTKEIKAELKRIGKEIAYHSEDNFLSNDKNLEKELRLGALRDSRLEKPTMRHLFKARDILKQLQTKGIAVKLTLP